MVIEDESILTAEEKEYIKEIKKIYKSQKPKEKVEVEGVLMPKKLFRKESKRTCPECKIYSFDMKDNLYMAKFKCCYMCYLKKDFREKKSG